MRERKHPGLVLFICLLVVACGKIQPTAVPTSTPIPPTNTAVPTSTPIPPTNTAVPTSTPIPPTNTAVPTSTPVPPTDTPTPTVTPTLTATPTPFGIHITGVITNLVDVKEYLTQKSYLQLVVYPPEDDKGRREVIFVYNGDGTVGLLSELAQISVPLDGVFQFQVETLEPGEYFITIQSYRPPDMLNFKAMTLNRDNGVAFFEVPEGFSLPLHIDMGKVTVQFP